MRLLFCGVLLLLATSCCLAAKQLQTVQIAHRHGDRAPITIIPGTEQIWQGLDIGPGQLSAVGMRQLNALGDYVKANYAGVTDVLDASFESNWQKLRIRSTDINRTLESSQAIWRTVFPSSVVPIHTRPILDDMMLFFMHNCPSFQGLWEASTSAQLSAQIQKEHPQFIAQLRQIWKNSTKANMAVVDMLTQSHDNVVCLEAHNQTVPNAAQWKFLQDNLDEFVQLIHRIHWARYANQGAHDKRGVIAAKLARQFVINMDLFKSDAAKTRFYEFSAHDTTLIGMLDSIGVLTPTSQLLIPQYATAFILEHWKDSDTGAETVEAKIGWPSRVSGSDQWTYTAGNGTIRALPLQCGGSEAQDECTLADWSAFIKARASGAGCCYHGDDDEIFAKLGCDDWTRSFDSLNMCTAYRKWCPVSSCQSGYILGAASQTCHKLAQDGTNTASFLAPFIVFLLLFLAAAARLVFLARKQSSRGGGTSFRSLNE